MCDNYPDDIRSWDKDPRSPFYEGPTVLTCTKCGEDNWAEDYETDDCVCNACVEYLKEAECVCDSCTECLKEEEDGQPQ